MNINLPYPPSKFPDQSPNTEMALALSLKLSVTPPSSTPAIPTQPNPSLTFRLPPVVNSSWLHPKLTITNAKTRTRVLIRRAVEESQESAESETATEEEPPVGELGAEIKKAMMERREKEKEGGLWSGVGEEIQEIEWPAFGKVLGTTGVVLGVIVGSSVVLLTVNAVLAELSDRVFAGRGLQDFFS